jgi:hypothetical protein
VEEGRMHLSQDKGFDRQGDKLRRVREEVEPDPLGRG